MIYRIMDETGSEIARVEGDTVATHAVVVVTPCLGEHFTRDVSERIKMIFNQYGIKAIVCAESILVTQIFLPED